MFFFFFFYFEDFLGDTELLPVYNFVAKGFLKELYLFYRMTGVLCSGIILGKHLQIKSNTFCASLPFQH